MLDHIVWSNSVLMCCYQLQLWHTTNSFESCIGNLIFRPRSLDFPFPLISFALAHQRQQHMLSHPRPRAHLSPVLLIPPVVWREPASTLARHADTDALALSLSFSGSETLNLSALSASPGGSRSAPCWKGIHSPNLSFHPPASEVARLSKSIFLSGEVVQLKYHC